jgi:predicted DsbA family dithiol-disulfide isomerase
MNVDVWSDVVCPWCYVGKRRLEAAVAAFPHRDELAIRWRSFELDPTAPRRREVSPSEHLGRKYGMTAEQVAASWERLTALAAAEGLEFHLDRTEGGNSFDAHRLIHLAEADGAADAMKERLLRAYFTESAPIGEPDVLEVLAVEVGLGRSEVADVLSTNRFEDAVREDERQARAYGIDGVPFFAIDGRYGVSGAQSSELLLQALSTAWAERQTD